MIYRLCILALFCFACSQQEGKTQVEQSPDTTKSPTMQSLDSDPEALENALHQLSSEHGQDRFAGIGWLAERESIAREAVLDLARQQNPLMGVLGAIEVLGIWHNEADIPFLTELAGAEDSRDWEAIKALMNYRSEAAYAAVLALSQQSSEDRAGYAVMALGPVGGEGARQDLEKFLQNSAATLRYQALRGLQQLGIAKSRQAIEALKETEKDGDVMQLLNEILR